jgi:SAM-dependent methyltransferase
MVPPDPFRFDPGCDALVHRLCSQARDGAPVLNLGSGTTQYGRNVVNLDLRLQPGIQLCGDGTRLPVRDCCVAGVLLRGVLEHVRSAEAVRQEVVRVLQPGGFVYVEVPFLQPYHLSPEDHRRFTLPGLRHFLSEFDEQESGVQSGPGSALAWVLRETLGTLLSFGSARAYPRALALAGWATFWVKYLDRLIVPAPHAANAASAVYFLGRRRA